MQNKFVVHQKTVEGVMNMAFERYEIIIIYGDGTQSRLTIGASSYGEARSKAQATASCGAASHKGVDDIIVNKL